MSKHKDIVRGGGPRQKIRDGTRLMHTHETMVDFISGRHHANSFLDVFTSSLIGLDFLKTFGGNLEEDLIYSDDDYYDDDDDDDDEDDDDDHDYDPFGPRKDVHGLLKPHPRIRQLTDEEADQHAKELLEEERRKERTERNKRKKMRKKEKKRLEKENAVKDILPEEEAEKSDTSENPVIESKAEANESPESGETQNATVAAGRDESGDDDDDHHDNNNNKEDLNPIKKENEELKEPQQELDLNNSYVSTAKSEPEETCNQQPSKERKKEKTHLQEVQLSEEKKPKPVEKAPEVQKKEEKQEPNKEQAVDTTVEQLAKRSRELAGIGNRLAASGQFEAAVKYFTDAIKYNPKEFKLFGNRSLCYERTQQYEKALRDADVALSMQPNWIKGLFRKGKALSGLKRYYDATLIYKEVLRLESSSTEAKQELKRAQTLHLMEMGFSWAQSSEALKTHATLEEAVEALFSGDCDPAPGDAGASRNTVDPPVVQEEDDDEGEWIVRQTSRPRTQQIRETDALSPSRSKSQSPTPNLRNLVKPPLFSVWVGSLASSITYPTLHDLFSRAGTVYSIKMLLEQQCAFVNYTRKEECDRAIQCFNGMVVEGSPLSVRYPSKLHSGPGLFKKECFFWRTTGCTRADCTYKHVPENKNIDKDKFTSRLGNFHM